MKREEFQIMNEYIEPSIEILWLDAKEDVIRTSNPGLDNEEDYDDEGSFDDTFGGL